MLQLYLPLPTHSAAASILRLYTRGLQHEKGGNKSYCTFFTLPVNGIFVAFRDSRLFKKSVTDLYIIMKWCVSGGTSFTTESAQVVQLTTTTEQRDICDAFNKQRTRPRNYHQVHQRVVPSEVRSDDNSRISQIIKTASKERAIPQL